MKDVQVMNIDFELVMFDFAEKFQGDEAARRKALLMFHALLLDEVACRARVELLRALREKTANLGEASTPPQVPHDETDLTEPIRQIVARGTLRAVDEGKVTYEQLAALSCDPIAIWKIHCAIRKWDHGAASPEQTEQC